MTSDKAADLLFRAKVKRTGQPQGKVKSKMPESRDQILMWIRSQLATAAAVHFRDAKNTN